MEVIEEASTPSSSNSATTSRRSSGHGTAVTSVSTATSTSELRDKATSTIDEPSPSTSGVNSGTNSGESTPIGKLSIRVVGDLTKSAPVMASSSLGDYKIEKSEKKSSTSSSSSSTSANSDDSTNGSCFSCCQGLNQGTLTKKICIRHNYTIILYKINFYYFYIHSGIKYNDIMIEKFNLLK